MATYAVGDVQGCFDELVQVLGHCGYDQKRDRLWFVGDLVNRGPKSLEVLRFVRDLGTRAVTVLGNHDLHLVMQFEGFERPRADDTFEDVLDAPDAKELVDWLRGRPMMHRADDCAMVHAGLLPQWSIARAAVLAKEVEAALKAPAYRDFLSNLYGSKPSEWNDSLAGWDRLRVIVNAMTRMRFCTAGGRMEFNSKSGRPPDGYRPWFELRPKDRQRIIFGHWSTLGLKLTRKVAGLDTGCVWGGSLTVLRLEDGTIHQTRCGGYQAPGAQS